jgi:hypothetical protein
VLGEKPDGRFVHRVVAIGEELLLFGGRTSKNVKFNDVHWFNTKTLTWRSDPVSSHGHEGFGFWGLSHTYTNT